MAQFLRQDTSWNEDNIFELDVTTMPPQISTTPALRLNAANLIVGSSYQIQASPDLINWTNYGTPFIAVSNNAVQYVDQAGSKGFFRISPQ